MGSGRQIAWRWEHGTIAIVAVERKIRAAILDKCCPLRHYLFCKLRGEDVGHRRADCFRVGIWDMRERRCGQCRGGGRHQREGPYDAYSTMEHAWNNHT